MGVMDKFLNIMKLGDDDDDYYDDDDYADEEEEEEDEEAPRKRPSRIKGLEDGIEAKKPQPKVTPMRQPVSRRMANSSGMEVCVIKPTSVEDAREITETLLGNRTVVLNLEGLDVDVAQRIIDFTSGSCFAISGNLQKISHYIFIITPPSVDISGDFQEILGSLDGPIDNSL